MRTQFLLLVGLFGCEDPGAADARTDDPAATDPIDPDSGRPEESDPPETAPPHTAETGAPPETGESAPGPSDADGDGATADADCDDGDDRVHPGAFDACLDGVDADCDGSDRACVDPIPAGEADAILRGDYRGLTVGYALATAGDCDGDGSDDLVVGAPLEEGIPKGPIDGAAYMVLGGARLFGELGLDVSAGRVSSRPYATTYEYSQVGRVLNAVGDLDGDGRDDVVVGDLWEEHSNPAGDYVWVSLGVAYGGLRGDTLLPEVDTRIWEADGSSLLNATFGGGDLDGDGQDDLVVGASNWGIWAGAAWVLPGPLSGDVYLSEAGHRLEAEQADSFTGRYLDVIGDHDGDGLDDLAIAAFSFDAMLYDEGKVYFVLGPVENDMVLDQADGQLLGALDSFYLGQPRRVGDVDGDGRDDLAIGATDYRTEITDPEPMPGAVFLIDGPGARGHHGPLRDPDALLRGEADYDRFGESLTGRDVDADGRSDLIVGATQNGRAQRAGEAYVFAGPVDGNRGARDADLAFEGEYRLDQFGHAVAAGDYDGDGWVDLAIGAPFHEGPGGVSAGAAYLFYGPLL